LAKPEGPGFVESAVYVVTVGQFAGEYVASCAKGDCSYFGKASSLIKQWIQVDVRGYTLQYSWSAYTTKTVSRSDHILVEVRIHDNVDSEFCSTRVMLHNHIAFGEHIPPQVTHTSEQRVVPRAAGPSRPLKRSYAMLGRLKDAE
jgi:hypothetical protein